MGITALCDDGKDPPAPGPRKELLISSIVGQTIDSMDPRGVPGGGDRREEVDPPTLCAFPEKNPDPTDDDDEDDDEDDEELVGYVSAFALAKGDAELLLGAPSMRRTAAGGCPRGPMDAKELNYATY